MYEIWNLFLVWSMTGPQKWMLLASLAMLTNETFWVILVNCDEIQFGDGMVVRLRDRVNIAQFIMHYVGSDVVTIFHQMQNFLKA